MKNIFIKNCCDGMYNSFDVHFTSACDNKCAHCVDQCYEGMHIVKPDVDKIVTTILENKDGLDDLATKITEKLRSLGYTVEEDTSGTIGKRYARSDEIGVPLAITVDYESLDDNEVTIRNRDDESQDRIPINSLENSEGWIVINPKSIHLWAPNLLSPITNTNSNSITFIK